MPRGSRFGPLGKKLVIAGNAQHGALTLRVVELIHAGAGLFCALAPVPRVVKEGSTIHGLAPLQLGYSTHEMISQSQPSGCDRRHVLTHLLDGDRLEELLVPFH